jgi:hypothetical protein
MLSSLSPVSFSPFALMGTLAAMGILVFFGAVVQKEFAGARSRVERIKLVGQVVVIGAAPLLIVLILVMIQSIVRMAH